MSEEIIDIQSSYLNNTILKCSDIIYVKYILVFIINFTRAKVMILGIAISLFSLSYCDELIVF